MEANSTEPIKKCSRCGTVLNDKPKFCPNCGSKILWENKKTEYSMAHNVLKVFFSILPFPVIVIFLGIMFSFIYALFFDNDGIKVTEPKKERTEADIKRDSITTEIAKEARVTFQEIKSFEKEVNGLTVVSISTGNLPLDIFHTLPACNIKLVNALEIVQYLGICSLIVGLLWMILILVLPLSVKVHQAIMIPFHKDRLLI